MKKLKQKIELLKNKHTTIFFVVAVLVVYVLLKAVLGVFQRLRNDSIVSKTNAENEAVQSANTNQSVTAVRSDICIGIAKSIKQQVDDYGFIAKYISFNPTPYIQDVNRMNGGSEAIYCSKYYQNNYGRSLKADLQMLAYSENPLFSWETKGGRYSDIKQEIKDVLF